MLGVESEKLAVTMQENIEEIEYSNSMIHPVTGASSASMVW
jgi:hypothetical protein